MSDRIHDSNPSKTWRGYAWLASGVALRALFLTRRSLWFDEAKSLIIAAAPAARIPDLVRKLEGIPPLYFWIVHAWGKAFGDPLLALRSFSFAFGVAALWSFLRVCRGWPGGRTAFALACLSSFWIHASQDGRVYALFLFESVLLLQFAAALAETWTWKNACGYAAAGAIGLYTHVYFPVVLLAHFLYLCVRLPRKRLPAWILLHAAVAATLIPWAPSLLAQMGRGDTALLRTYLNPRQCAAILGSMAVDLPFLSLAFPGWIEAVGWGLLAAIGLLFIARAKKGEPLPRFAAWHALAPFVLVRLLEAALGRPLGQARYFVFVSPALYLLLGELSAGAAPSRKAARIGLLIAMGVGAAGYHAAGFWLDPHLAAMSREIRAHAGTDVPVVHRGGFYFPSMRYYYLPERTQYVACADPSIVRWDGFPGGSPEISPGALRALGPVVYVDPERRWTGDAVGASTGARLAELGCR